MKYCGPLKSGLKKKEKSRHRMSGKERKGGFQGASMGTNQ